MIRPLFFFCFVALITSCTSQLPDNIAQAAVVEPEPYHAHYDRSALQNLKWLTGDWKGKEAGRTIKHSFVFHTDHILEIIPIEGGNQKSSQFFIWKDGHYYYGQNRQWVVTWISEKNIRFEPLVPGLAPMTWCRLNDNKWHLKRHTDKGDETIVMERASEMPS